MNHFSIVITNLFSYSLKVTKDWKLLKDESGLESCIVGMGCLESSFFYQTTPSISSYDDPDVPALLVYLQYLIQAEVSEYRTLHTSFRYLYFLVIFIALI